METATDHTKRLYKSRRNRMIDGVCAGIAEYLGIDPTILRIAWVLTIFIGGTGILAYIAAMIIIPANPEPIGSPPTDSTARRSTGTRRFWGMMLVILGCLMLMTNLGMFGIFHLWHVSWTILFAILVIMCGIYLILRSPAGNEQQSIHTETNPDGTVRSSIRRFTRIHVGRKILGVCGGLAKYFEIDPSIVRVLYVIFVFITHGFGIIVYFAMALILPEEEPQHVS